MPARDGGMEPNGEAGRAQVLVRSRLIRVNLEVEPVRMFR
jgi:hypothetical protein